MVEEVKKQAELIGKDNEKVHTEIKKINSNNNEKRVSYADAIRNNNKKSEVPQLKKDVAIIVKPKGKQTSEKTKQDLNNKVDPKNLKISNIETRNNGVMVIHSENNDEREKIKLAIENNIDREYEVKVPEQIRPSFVVTGIMFKYENDVLIDTIKKQNECITTWMIVAEKNNLEVHALFNEYLVALMDMFRRLSRAEKLVFNLLKSLKEWLNKFKILSATKTRKSLKRKAVDTIGNDSKMLNTIKDDVENYFLNIIFKEFHNVISQPAKSKNRNVFEIAFPYLHETWPSESVGVAFSKLITGLVSKPALVIWKSLLYSLKELLENLQQEPEIACQENNLFLLELHAALLCQYFSGCRLIEQYDKFSNEINEQLLFTAEVLTNFGHFILSQEHNNRPMNAFLEGVFHATNFVLLLHYYRPDGFQNEGLPRLGNLHGFLNIKEWGTIQQHVLKWGKSHSKFLFNRLLLQRTQAQTLLHSNQDNSSYANDLQKAIQSTAADKLPIDITMLIEKTSAMKWFICHMARTEKCNFLKQLLDTPLALEGVEDDLESLEILAVILCVRISQIFAVSKGSILATLQFDFDELIVFIQTDQITADKELVKFIQLVEKHSLCAYKFKKQPNVEETQKLLALLRQLPLGHLRRQLKTLLFTMLIAFYSDLKSMYTAETDKYSTEVFEIIIDFLHFGQHVRIFKYFSLSTILNIFPVTDAWQFYEFVFSSIKSEEQGSEQFLKSLADNLEIAQAADCKLGDDQRRLLLSAIEAVAALSGKSAKRQRKLFERLLAIYSKYIINHFSKCSESEKDLSVDNYAKKDKKFVEKTLAGFAPYANALLLNASSANGQDNKAAVVVDENFRRICKIYIGHSMDYRNPDAIRLMQVALHHRQLLHLDQDEIEFVLSHYWLQLNANLKQFNLLDANTLKLTEMTVKMIIGNKTNEDLLLTLQSLANNLDDLKDFRNTLRCLELIAKCSFSTIKGAIFNENFKSITSKIIMRLFKDEQQQFVDKEILLTILAAQKSLVENKTIPISTYSLDDILAFLMDINIKHFPISDDNLCIFKKLHLSMSDLLGALLRQRHMLLMDRVPPFMHIFKNLIQSILWYKSDRQKDIALTETELEDLAELAIKLEALMHLIAEHSIHVKRIAPFVLTFVISLMVADKRATTLYPKIKTHIDNICYDLIGICDHRVGRFVLRCSNEAARQVYELYVKDHNKYHKFKGKV
ncbi:uncharacterized protein [Eurosta solidaginis]|uniref:uncharacterized protein isoform X2 n=1 Tax=Eurosta solidaginis TaxID=178769 RepID=UPI003530DC35